MMRPIPASCKKLVQDFEKCELVCFDTDGAHVPTIGWGRTKGLTRADVGRLACTQRQADTWLDNDLTDAATELLAQIGVDPVDAMTDNQYGAMVSFTYNEGAMGVTLKAILRSKIFDSVPPQLQRYVYAHQPDGTVKKLMGLVRRRAAEIALWNTNEPGTLDINPSSAVTRTVRTPPAPAPVGQKPTLIAAGVAAVAATVPTAQAAIAATPPHYLNYVLAFVAFLTITTFVVALVKARTVKAESDGAPSGPAERTTP